LILSAKQRRDAFLKAGIRTIIAFPVMLSRPIIRAGSRFFFA
jgi:hypothetical protein